MSSFHSSNLRHVHLSLNRGIIEIPKKIPNDKNPISLTPECTPPPHQTQADYQMNFSNSKTFVLINVANNKVQNSR